MSKLNIIEEKHMSNKVNKKGQLIVYNYNILTEEEKKTLIESYEYICENSTWCDKSIFAVLTNYDFTILDNFIKAVFKIFGVGVVKKNVNNAESDLIKLAEDVTHFRYKYVLCMLAYLDKSYVYESIKHGCIYPIRHFITMNSNMQEIKVFDDKDDSLDYDRLQQIIVESSDDIVNEWIIYISKFSKFVAIIFKALKDKNNMLKKKEAEIEELKQRHVEEVEKLLQPGGAAALVAQTRFEASANNGSNIDKCNTNMVNTALVNKNASLDSL
jgi:hypothetical protein